MGKPEIQDVYEGAFLLALGLSKSIYVFLVFPLVLDNNYECIKCRQAVSQSHFNHLVLHTVGSLSFFGIAVKIDVMMTSSKGSMYCRRPLMY